MLYGEVFFHLLVPHQNKTGGILLEPLRCYHKIDAINNRNVRGRLFTYLVLELGRLLL